MSDELPESSQTRDIPPIFKRSKEATTYLECVLCKRKTQFVDNDLTCRNCLRLPPAPTPQEIRQRTAEIQAEWTRGEKIIRRARANIGAPLMRVYRDPRAQLRG